MAYKTIVVKDGKIVLTGPQGPVGIGFRYYNGAFVANQKTLSKADSAKITNSSNVSLWDLLIDQNGLVTQIYAIADDGTLSLGLSGVAGIQYSLKGPQGDKGDKGDTGAQGPKGEKGDKGDKGDTGAQGLQGATGATGAQGPKGEKGDTGATGPKGDKGDKGDTGSVANISVTGSGNAVTSVALNGDKSVTVTKGASFVQQASLSYDAANYTRSLSTN